MISTKVGDIPACVKNGENGVLVSPGDTDGLEKALSVLTNDEEIWHRYSRNARNTIETDFDEKQFYQHIISVWKKSACHSSGFGD